MRLRSDERALVEAALGVRERAYAPYSHFLVGAALLSEDGRTFLGCNVENASFGATMCAERNAVGAAVAAGARRFKLLAVATEAHPPAPPCGLCRQVLSEFAPALRVILVNPAGTLRRVGLDRLLPVGFDAQSLSKR